MNGFCNQKNRKGGCFAKKKTTKIGCNVHIIITCSKLIPLFALWWNSIGLSLRCHLFSHLAHLQWDSNTVTHSEIHKQKFLSFTIRLSVACIDWMALCKNQFQPIISYSEQQNHMFISSIWIFSQEIHCFYFLQYFFFFAYLCVFFLYFGWILECRHDKKMWMRNMFPFFLFTSGDIKRIMCINFTMSFVYSLLLLMIADDMIFFIDEKEEAEAAKKNRVPLQWTHIFPKKDTLWVFRIKR